VKIKQLFGKTLGCAHIGGTYEFARARITSMGHMGPSVWVVIITTLVVPIVTFTSYLALLKWPTVPILLYIYGVITSFPVMFTVLTILFIYAIIGLVASSRVRPNAHYYTMTGNMADMIDYDGRPDEGEVTPLAAAGVYNNVPLQRHSVDWNKCLNPDYPPYSIDDTLENLPAPSVATVDCELDDRSLSSGRDAFDARSTRSRNSAGVFPQTPNTVADTVDPALNIGQVYAAMGLAVPILQYEDGVKIRSHRHITDTTLRMPKLATRDMEARMREEVSPYLCTFDLPSSPYGLLPCVVTYLRAEMIKRCSTDHYALVVDDDPLEYPLDGFYHYIWMNRHRLNFPALSSIHHLTQAVHDGKRYWYRMGSLPTIDVRADYMCFNMSQYAHTPQSIFVKALECDVTTVYMIGFSNLDMLTKSMGHLPSIGLKWRVMGDGVTKTVIHFTSLMDATVSFTLDYHLCLQHMLVQSVMVDGSSFNREVVSVMGDLQLFKYARNTQRLNIETVEIHNFSARHFKVMMNITHPGTPYKKGRATMMIAPIHTINTLISKAHDSTHASLQSIASNMSTMRSTFERYASTTCAKSYIDQIGDTTALSSVVMNVTRMLKRAGTHDENDTLVYYNSFNLCSYLRLLFSNEFRVQMYAHEAAMAMCHAQRASGILRSVNITVECVDFYEEEYPDVIDPLDLAGLVEFYDYNCNVPGKYSSSSRFWEWWDERRIIHRTKANALLLYQASRETLIQMSEVIYMVVWTSWQWYTDGAIDETEDGTVYTRLLSDGDAGDDPPFLTLEDSISIIQPDSAQTSQIGQGLKANSDEDDARTTMTAGSYHRPLGHPTMHQDLSMMLDMSTYAASSVTGGVMYSAANGALAECVFKCPLLAHKFALRHSKNSPQEYYMTLFSVANIIVVKGNLYIGKAKSKEDLEQSAIVIHSEIGFRRFVPNDYKSYHATLQSYINVQGNLRDLFVLSGCGLEDVPAVGCLYSVLSQAIPDKPMASANVVQLKCIEQKVAILHNEYLYVPGGIITKVIYVQHNHAMKLPNADISEIMSIYPSRQITSWSVPLNGPMPAPLVDRFAQLQQLEDKLKALPPRGRRFEHISEAFRYNIALERNLLSVLSLLNDSTPTSYLRASTEMLVYDTRRGKFINGQPEVDYEFCWSRNQFQTAEYDQVNKIYKCANPGEYLFFSKDIMFLRERQITNLMSTSLDDVYRYDLEAIKIVLYNGVPGCGKTSSIIRDHRPGTDLVCTATRAAKLDYLQQNKVADFTPKYRTYDSVLLNGCESSDLMYADEGLMVHAGELLLCAWACGAKEIRIYGDTEQIPFINRCIGFTVHNHILCADMEEKQVTTYRNPKCMLKILRQFYPDIKIGSKNQGEVRKYSINSALEIEDLYDAYLVFQQEEKKLLKHLPKDKILSVHESEGKTFNNVALIRLRPQANGIYRSKPHVIVAISRHRNILHYHTVLKDDYVWDVLEGNLDTSEQKLEKLEKSFEPVANPGCFYPNDYVVQTFKDPICEEQYNRYLEWLANITSHTDNMSTYHQIQMFRTEWPTDTCITKNIDTAMVQMLYDGIFDPNPVEEQVRMQETGIFPLPKEFKIDPVKLLKSFDKKEQQYLHPKLETVQPMRDPGNIFTAVTALNKRNHDPPVIHLTRPLGLVNDIVDIFMETYIDSERLASVKQTAPFSSKVHTKAWFNSRLGSRKKALVSYGTNEPIESLFAVHNRPDHKPKLDGSHVAEASAAQTVTAHHPTVTAKYAGFGQYIMNILQASLKDKWFINDGMCQEELNGATNFILHRVKEYIAQEIDFGKYDKSQEELCLDITIEVSRRLGVDETTLLQWREAHELNILSYFSLGLTLKTKYQRRSGDILTFTGNTIVLMAALAYAHDYKSAYGGVFGGDDSLVFLHPKTPVIDNAKIISDVFNLIAKLENFGKAPYFAGRFLIHAEGTFLLVPDPLKVITRLGKRDMFCQKHVQLAWISFADNYRCYKSLEVRIKVCNAAALRYARISKTEQMDFTLFGDFICELVTNEHKFIGLYYGPKEIMHRKMPKSLEDEIGRKQSRQRGRLVLTEKIDPFDEQFLLML
jgi:hypothetical protein